MITIMKQLLGNDIVGKKILLIIIKYIIICIYKNILII